MLKEVKAMLPGRQVWGKYLLLDKVERRTRDGKAVMNLRLGDLSGDIDAVAWESCSITGPLEKGTVVGLLGDTSQYNGRMQITARRIKSLDEDPLAFQRSADDWETLKHQFEQLLNSITDPYLKPLLDRVYSGQVREAFLRAPAARRIHHQYTGGLLEHTVTVARLCLDAVRIYADLNRDLVLAGALLHDIGKIEELSMKAAAEYTVAGRLLGHIYIGSELLSVTISNLRQEGSHFPLELELMLKHMILSHHGLLEFGSPVKPLFPEALLLHTMDNLDAKMHIFAGRIKDAEESPEDFTPYDSMFDQHYYKHRYQSPSDEMEGEKQLVEDQGKREEGQD